MFHDSVLWVGWGCTLSDFDNDGRPDCFVANGHIDENLERLGLDTPYAEPALLHRNLERIRGLTSQRARQVPTSIPITSGEDWPMATSTTTATSTW